MVYCKVVVGNKITDIYQFDTWEQFEEISEDMPEGQKLIPIKHDEFLRHVEEINKENAALDAKEQDSTNDITVNYIMAEESYSEEEDNLRLKIIALDYFKSKTAASLTEIKSIYKWLKDDSV